MKPAYKSRRYSESTYIEEKVIIGGLVIENNLKVRGSILPVKQSLEQPLQDVVRILRVARRPDRREFTLMLRICSLGLAILGVYGFIILYLSFIFLFR